MNQAEFEPMDERLERAVTEIRETTADDAAIAAAAGRVWTRLAAAQSPEHLRTCADFQALLPGLRAGTLGEARATLLRDHLHECVACRKVYEGRVVVMPPAPARARRAVYPVRWAAAAVVVLSAGAAVWLAVDQYGGRTGRALVQSVNGNLFAVGADGSLRPMAAGQDLPDGFEFRTARDSGAMLQLRDGSVVELRERSGITTSGNASDLTLRLNRGSIIVQAAKRRRGHLYVATADCRVAVTGTLFSVVSGVKGSRVSVVEGEVHVAQDNQDHLLHPGDQMSTSAAMDPEPLGGDIDWSRNRDRLQRELNRLGIEMRQIHLPALRYQSRLLGRLPADTAVFASIPNLGEYLAQAQAVFGKNLDESPELRQWWARQSSTAVPALDKLHAASEYLGDEVVMVVRSGASPAPVFLAETRRDGFGDFVKKTAPGITVATRPGLVAFGPNGAAAEALLGSLDATSAAFQATPFYTRIAEAYRQGAGMLVCADLARLDGHSTSPLRYMMSGHKEVRDHMETRVTFGFASPATGIAAWLAAPAPMGSLDYVSPDASLAAAFVVNDPGAIVDQVAAIGGKFTAEAEGRTDWSGVRQQLAASLGGEFSVSFDGPIFPPSWKLVTEVYDPARAEAAIAQAIEAYNRGAVAAGRKPLRTARETAEGRVYYTVAAADPNPLTEAHYTFDDGYLIAGPTRALLARALQAKTAGASITHSAKFLAMEPRDHFASYSAVVYENFGTSLAPLAGLLGAFAPPEARQQMNGRFGQLGNMKPLLLAAYAGRDEITVAANGENLWSGGLSSLLSGNLAGALGNALPLGQLMGGRRR